MYFLWGVCITYAEKMANSEYHEVFGGELCMSQFNLRFREREEPAPIPILSEHRQRNCKSLLPYGF